MSKINHFVSRWSVVIIIIIIIIIIITIIIIFINKSSSFRASDESLLLEKSRDLRFHRPDNYTFRTYYGALYLFVYYLISKTSPDIQQFPV